MVSDEKIIDLEDALDRVDGDRELYFELVDGFVDEFAAYRARLEAAARADGYPGFKELVHTVKGVLGNLSAVKAHKIAVDMDLKCKDERYQDAAERLPELVRAVSEFFDAASALKE